MLASIQLLQMPVRVGCRTEENFFKATYALLHFNGLNEMIMTMMIDGVMAWGAFIFMYKDLPHIHLALQCRLRQFVNLFRF